MTRRRINLNRDWKFFRGDCAGAEAADFDDSNWQPVGLPHTFDLPYFRTPEFYVGYGWYRKRFDVPPGWRGQRLSLEFDGAFQVSEVFVNGVRLGEHRGGYTGFRFDITDEVAAGTNVLAVRVNNNWDAQLQPRAGEHVFCGGIYRDVHMLVTNTLHVARNGTVVTTPHVSRDAATVRVCMEALNESYETPQCAIATQIIDPDGRVVTTMRAEAQTVQWGRTCFDQTSEPIANPRLWHPDHPHLYTVRTQLFDNGDMLVDEFESPLGFRWFEWTADRGFFLNGEHLYLRGANAHQDHAGWGIGITRAACERDVRLMKEAGFNFLRGAHYPHHPAFADACDRLGLLFWSENAFWGKGGFGPEGYWNASAYPVNEADFEPFEQSCHDQLRDMICTNRNHPSIIAWSMTNEAFFTFHLDRARALMADLVRLSRDCDPTRPAAIGGAQRGDIDKLGDVAGYNGDGARLFIDPGVPNIVSEYGAISKAHDAYEPFYGELQPEEYPWRGGQAIWAGFDYGSIAGKQGLKGIVNHQRVPKRSWHWYRNAYRGVAPPEWPIEGTPAKLQLTADKLIIDGTDATDDVQITVTVHDAAGRRVKDSSPVTLTIESGPGEFPTGPSITFDTNTDIGIADGEAAMAFRSYYGGESVIRATSPGLADATITITTLGEPRFVQGVTPLVADRPYVPPPESDAARAAMRNAVNVALNRPCRASSEIDSHPARFANDGQPTTSWRAGEPLAWWLVDLEGFYQVASLRLVFEHDGDFRFIVAVSNDAQSWTTAIDRSNTSNTKAVRNDVFDPGTAARYVRIRFVSPGEQPNLREVELLGILAVR